MSPKITLIIHTASHDNFLAPQGIKSYFNSVTNNLQRQTVQDFEFSYVDTHYELNKSWFADSKGFTIKHVPVHHNHRYWYNQNHCYISAAKNTGILYADGELVISADDAEFFPPTMLERYWNHYTSGCLCHAIHKRMRSIKATGGDIDYPIDGDIYINDHRWKYLDKQPSHQHDHGSWCFAGTSFPLSDAIKLNGYNERMDACKSLEDCDFGNRLRLWSPTRNFVIDNEVYAYIVDHQSYADAINCGWDEHDTDCQETVIPAKQKIITNLIAVENYGVLKWSDELKEITANKNPITDKHLAIIQRETIKYRHFDPLAPANEINLDNWKNTPTFDLAEERKQLRESIEWRW